MVIRRTFILVLVALVLITAGSFVVLAGGQGESPAAESADPSAAADDHDHDDDHDDDHDHDHDHDHDGVPSVEPAALESDERLQVVATTNIVGDVVRNIIGDRADLTVLIPQGQNPHGYTPAPRAVAAIERAHVVFVNGFDL
ncbi:MAG: metal ABC transporter solute-binding protein, Zn/Mn family, partial [Alkalispirochaeta sp.]